MATDERVRKQVVLDWLEQMARDYPKMDADGVAGCFQEEFDFWPEEVRDDPVDRSSFTRGGPSINDARRSLREQLADGTTCPVCDQYAKIYRRKIHANMAHTLFDMYRVAGRSWCYLPDIPQKSRDTTFLALWDLIEEETTRRDDGGRAGWWRITLAGEEWLLGKRKVPKYVYVYNGEIHGTDGEPWSIKDALGKKFSYNELMENV